MDGFIIIGNGNAVTYKDIFPLIKENKMWIGNKSFISGMDMLAGKNFDAQKCKHPKYDEIGNIIIRITMCTWFTNIENQNFNTPIKLYKKYNPTDYPKYYNFDGINVDKVADIPMDYDGIMGVPISFLDKYCPTQFEIIGNADAGIVPNGWKGMSNDFIKLYYSQGNTGQLQKGNRLACFIDSNGKAKVPYKRILIRKRKNKGE